jgi:hypothetical protein
MLSRHERAKLNWLSLKAFGAAGRWKKLYDRGFLLPNGYKLGLGKGGWRAGTGQARVVRKRISVYYSIGVIRRIMLNRIRILETLNGRPDQAP